MSVRHREEQLLERARTSLEGLLGPGWRVKVRPSGLSDGGFDGLLELREGSSTRNGRQSTIFTVVKPRPTPSALHAHARSVVEQLPAGSHSLLVADWLSPRSREVLSSYGLNYLDSTGNVSLRLDDPVIVLRTEGEQQDPSPVTQGRGLGGRRAGRLVRELVDIEPPRRPRDLAKNTGLSEGYVSRLLHVMADEALITRDGSWVVDVDWQALLRARAATYQLLKANTVQHALPRMGLQKTLARLRQHAGEGAGRAGRILVTGHYMANALSPMAVGGPTLMLYVDPEVGPGVVDEVTRELGLLRTGRATEESVWLLRPNNYGVFDRPWHKTVDGLRCVGPSQLALDCLTGPGRLPAQGEAVIEWMVKHEKAWRERPHYRADPRS